MIPIYILTYKRPRVATLRYFEGITENVTLVVQDTDRSLADEYPDIARLELPPTIRDVAATRQYIVEHALDRGQEKILQLDDDLTIGVLKEAGKYNLRDAEPMDLMLDILPRIERLLNHYPHVGATARNEVHLNYLDEVKTCARAIRFHGMRPRDFFNLGININRVPTIEDYDFILQLLRKGVENGIDCQTYVGDGGSNAEGGCSEMRAELRDGEAARKLEAFHPGFVKLVEKETKIKGGVWKRTDVRVSWKKAFEAGCAERSGLL